MNQYEEAARARKVGRLCDAIDVALLNLGVNCYSPSALQIVSTLTHAQWTLAAGAAEVYFPSDATRAEVISRYRRRVESPALEKAAAAVCP